MHSASLVTSNPGSGKENSLLDAGHTGRVLLRTIFACLQPKLNLFLLSWAVGVRVQNLTSNLPPGAKSRSNGLAAILTHDFDNDDDDTFGAVGRSKRNRGGVCGTPTDEDGSERPRVTRSERTPFEKHFFF